MKIINKAQKHQTRKDHEDSFFFKNKTSRHMYDYPKLTICIHIPNIKGVYNSICMKARDSRVYMFVY